METQIAMETQITMGRMDHSVCKFYNIFIHLVSQGILFDTVIRLKLIEHTNL